MKNKNLRRAFMTESLAIAVASVGVMHSVLPTAALAISLPGAAGKSSSVANAKLARITLPNPGGTCPTTGGSGSGGTTTGGTTTGGTGGGCPSGGGSGSQPTSGGHPDGQRR